jgi:plastocyanin
MPWSARRLLVLIALVAVAASATAQAAPRAKGGAARAAKAKRKATKKTRAVKLHGDVAWVPPAGVSASRPPLTGTAAPGGGGTAGGVPPSGGAGAGPGASGGPSGPTTTLPTDPPALQALGATVDERTGYTLRLSRTALSGGTVVVQLINQGEDPHNLRIVRTDPGGAGTPAVDLPETGPQQQSTTTLSLAAGSYYLFCTLTTPKSHEQAGMHATLRVDP